MDSENKQRVSLYLDKKTIQVVDTFIKKKGLHSRNEFFERAAVNLSILLDTFNSNKFMRRSLDSNNTAYA